MAVWYLDSEDEITDAVARLRGATEEQVVFVVPTGSRIATGRINFKLLSREQWMEDTLNHTSRAFLGLTMHCAKCHNHMYDPVTQNEYYRLRAIFEPHDVRTDRIPGQLDTAKDGLVRTYDKDLKVATYFFPRGDERHPDKEHALTPGIPLALGGTFHVEPGLPGRNTTTSRPTTASSRPRVSPTRSP